MSPPISTLRNLLEEVFGRRKSTPSFGGRRGNLGNERFRPLGASLYQQRRATGDVGIPSGGQVRPRYLSRDTDGQVRPQMRQRDSFPIRVRDGARPIASDCRDRRSSYARGFDRAERKSQPRLLRAVAATALHSMTIVRGPFLQCHSVTFTQYVGLGSR